MARLAPRDRAPEVSAVRSVVNSPRDPAVAGAASRCGDTEDGFEPWLESFRRDAASQNISSRTLTLALSEVSYDDRVIALDRSQGAFKLTLKAFTEKRVTRARTARGRALLQTHSALLAKIDATFGVAPEILVAIWGLETDYGQNAGSMSAFRSLATLAYDCRRSERFRAELLSALRIVERGDLTPSEMIGAWAGEIGQTQFLPSSYERFAIDFDGDGKADLIGSSADALASTASYLHGHGWRPHEGFVPGTPNFAALGEWNASEIYRKAIALFAQKLKEKK